MGRRAAREKGAWLEGMNKGKRLNSIQLEKVDPDFTSQEMALAKLFWREEKTNIEAGVGDRQSVQIKSDTHSLCPRMILHPKLEANTNHIFFSKLPAYLLILFCFSFKI